MKGNQYNQPDPKPTERKTYELLAKEFTGESSLPELLDSLKKSLKLNECTLSNPGKLALEDDIKQLEELLKT